MTVAYIVSPVKCNFNDLQAGCGIKNLTSESNIFILLSHRVLNNSYMVMAVVTQYANRIAELEERVRRLSAERDTLRSEVQALKERLVFLTLEREAESLESEVSALVREKSELEQKIASIEGPETVQEQVEASGS